MRAIRRAAIVAAVALGGFVVVQAGIAIGHHVTGNHHGLTGYQVQQMTGAGSCNPSSYYITDRLDRSKATLYDCWTSGKGYMCVTVQDGVASNVTVEARALFASTLGAAKPACVRG